MKSLKETILESNNEYQNYDDVVKFAKTNSTYNEVKSDFGRRGKAFEITFNNDIVLHVEFLGNSECLYSFLQNGNEIYGINSSTFAEKIDWETLINNPKNWVDNKITELQNGLKSTERKIKSAERKYEKTRKLSDSQNWIGWQNFYKGIELSINKLSTIKSML